MSTLDTDSHPARDNKFNRNFIAYFIGLSIQKCRIICYKFQDWASCTSGCPIIMIIIIAPLVPGCVYTGWTLNGEDIVVEPEPHKRPFDMQIFVSSSMLHGCPRTEQFLPEIQFMYKLHEWILQQRSSSPLDTHDVEMRRQR